jgi:uncharacterized NAD(P)/FAD-binding protein YdhS
VLGEYLGWFLDRVRKRAPAHVRIRLHAASAVDLMPDDDERLAIQLSDGTELTADYAFLTTGYTTNAERPSTTGLVGAPYPLPDRLTDVTAGQIVAIAGFGLAAMDMMSTLTVGRGGRFARDGAGGLTYHPGGREPTLVFYSRSGAPCRARPKLVEFGPKYQPRVLTHSAIDRRRRERGGRLDFDRDVLPLIYTEIRIAYRRCQARLAGGAEADRLLRERLGGAAGVEAVLDELDTELGRFDAVSTFDTTIGMTVTSGRGYQEWLTTTISADLAEGRLGFAGSPVKAGLDILRDLRDTIRYVVDYSGLTESSTNAFNRVTVPMMNRAVVGPQFERHEELLALMAAGLARAPLGPSPVVTWSPEANRWRLSSTRLDTPHVEEVDWVAAANVAWPAVESSASPLLQSLHRNGWITAFRPRNPYVPGLAIDRDHHPIRADGTVEPRVWVLGPLCEGATFYTNLVPSPRTFSRPIFDAHRSAAGMLAAAQRAPAPVATAGLTATRWTR